MLIINALINVVSPIFATRHLKYANLEAASQYLNALHQKVVKTDMHASAKDALTNAFKLFANQSFKYADLENASQRLNAT